MYILNITFCVSKAILPAWNTWLRTEHIPNMLADSHFSQPQLVRVLTSDPQAENSFSLQMHVPSTAHVETWMQTGCTQMQADLQKRFGQNVLFFTTCLEVLPC